MKSPQILAVVITASVTLTGIILTFIYNYFREKGEIKRHHHKIELEERRAKLEEKRMIIELYNQREIKIFEARLEKYPDLYKVLLKTGVGNLKNVTPEKALEFMNEINECVYTKVSHCLSTDSLIAVTELRDAFINYSKNLITENQLIESRLSLLQSLHKDLGRTGQYLGKHKPLIETDNSFQESLLNLEKAPS